jgi:hypothetical protein
MRIRDHDEPLQPGEFRDVDVTGQSIKESLMMLPYKEPSAVLFQLLGFAVDAGKSFAAIADMKMGEGNEQNPVGTTLALIERGTKVMSAIHKRLHYAQKIEFKLLAKVFQLYLPPQYPYMVAGGNQMIRPDPDLPKPMSPAMENASAMRGKDPKPFPMQDHQAHIAAHAEFMFTRMVQINPQLYAMLQAHVSEHISLLVSEQMQQKYAPQFQQIQQAMQQAQQNPQAMQQLQQQMDQLVNQQASEQAKMEAEMTKQLASDEEARISKEAQDPLVKLKQQEIDLKAMETQARLQKDMMVDAEKLDLQRDQLEANTTIDLMRVAADVNKEDSTEAMAVLKENMANTREAMKQNTNQNGRRKKATDET